MNEKRQIIDGIFVARYFKYYLQLKNQYVIYKLSVDKVSPKSLYFKHKQQFDRLATVCNKYNIDVTKYLDFFVNKMNKFEKDIDEQLVTIFMIRKYAEFIQLNAEHKTIYDNFIKTVNTIVEECITLNFNTVTDYLRYLIENRKLAAYYAAGKISTYYLAAIPKFKLVIEKLDEMSRAEFNLLHTRYDKYHSDINEVFLKFKNIKINPIKYTNDAILKAKNV